MSFSYSSPNFSDKEAHEEDLENLKQMRGKFVHIKNEVTSLIDVISIKNPHAKASNNKIKKDFNTYLFKLIDDLCCVQVCIENKIGNKSIFQNYRKPNSFTLYNDLDCVVQVMRECAQNDECKYTDFIFDRNVILEKVPSIKNYIEQYELVIDSLTEIT